MRRSVRPTGAPGQLLRPSRSFGTTQAENQPRARPRARAPAASAIVSGAAASIRQSSPSRAPGTFVWREPSTKHSSRKLLSATISVTSASADGPGTHPIIAHVLDLRRSSKCSTMAMYVCAAVAIPSPASPPSGGVMRGGRDSREISSQHAQPGSQSRVLAAVCLQRFSRRRCTPMRLPS